MKNLLKNEKTFQWIAAICIIVLIFLQYRLIISSYNIERREVDQTHLSMIKAAYEGVIINDKLYPGGQKIIDHFVGENQNKTLESIKNRSLADFKKVSDYTAEKIVDSLRSSSRMDSVFAKILKEINLDADDYSYALVLSNLAITFNGKEYWPLGSFSNQNTKLLIDGDPSVIAYDNLASGISVSGIYPYDNLVGFGLYIHRKSATAETIRNIAPLLSISSISIILITLIFYYTFNNWIKQKKLNEMSADFMNSITHEFKTPLTSIKVSLKNLTRETKNLGSDGIDNSINVISRQSDRINQLVDQVIDITTFNPYSIQLESNNLIESLEIIVYDMSLKYAYDPDIKIQFSSETQEVIVDYDIFSLTTAINNLIENGIKHNSNKRKQVSIETVKAEGHILIIIKDNGDGIDLIEQRYIFEKFYRGKENKEKGGLGLGLYYVRKMVEVHRWNIALKSQHSSGTTITIKI